MAFIKVTPEELSGQGDQLIQYASDIQDILGQIQTTIEAIDAGWDGLAMDAYYNMYTEMKQSLDQFPKLVDSLGNATKSAASAFGEVDDQLKSGFSGYSS